MVLLRREVCRVSRRKPVQPLCIWIYRVLFILMVFVGGTRQLDAVWSFSDLANGLMAIPNLISLLLLTGVIARESRRGGVL